MKVTIDLPTGTHDAVVCSALTGANHVILDTAEIVPYTSQIMRPRSLPVSHTLCPGCLVWTEDDRRPGRVQMLDDTHVLVLMENDIIQRIERGCVTCNEVNIDALTDADIFYFMGVARYVVNRTPYAQLKRNSSQMERYVHRARDATTQLRRSKYRGPCDIIAGCTQGFGHTGICNVVQTGTRKRHCGTMPSSDSKRATFLPPVGSDSAQRDDLLLTNPSDTTRIDGKTIGSVDMSPTLLDALRSHVHSRRLGTTDACGQPMYAGVGQHLTSCYIVHCANGCGDIVCGDSTMGAIVACAVELDPSLRTRNRVYAWMHAMKNDDGAVDVWLEKLRETKQFADE